MHYKSEKMNKNIFEKINNKEIFYSTNNVSHFSIKFNNLQIATKSRNKMFDLIAMTHCDIFQISLDVTVKSVKSVWAITLPSASNCVFR